MTISLRALLVTAAIAVVVRALLCGLVPVNGDEAYYTMWARHLEPGYYDQPPMIGWLLGLMRVVAEELLWYRAVAIVAGLVGALATYRLALPLGAERARFAAFLFIICPPHLALVVVTNDAALLLFGSLSLIFFQRLLERGRAMDALLCGAMVGAAFLCKYFGAFLGVGFAAALLGLRRSRGLRHTLLIALAASPFVAQHYWYNATHCFDTFRFNYLVRTEGLEINIAAIGSYLGLVVYAATPWGLVLLARRGREVLRSALLPLLIALAVPVLFFAVVGLRHIVGLHWSLAFLPLVFALFALLDRRARKIMAVATGAFSLLHVVAILAVLVIYRDGAPQSRFYHDTFVTTDFTALCEELDGYDGLPMFGFGYSPVSVISLECGRDIGVLFSQSIYGRQYDAWVDPRELDGRDLLLIQPRPLKEERLRPFFRALEVREREINGGRFTFAVGRGFDYPRYRREILTVTAERFYSIPEWLPMRSCSFLERLTPADNQPPPRPRVLPPGG